MSYSPDVLELNPGLTIAPKHNKFGNTRTEYNGVVYDSKAEADKARELDLLVKAGDIDFYLRQVNFPLPGGINYRADFVTYKAQWIAGPPIDRTHTWTIEVIEVKGFSTKEWKLKQKLFKQTYPNLTLRVEK